MKAHQTYQGWRINPDENTASAVRVMVNGNPLSPKPSQKIVNHSPNGFNWGYGGSGPAQLALAILLDCTENKEISILNYQDFKWKVVSKWDSQWTITSDEVADFLKNGRN